MWEPETASRRNLIEEPQVLVPPYLPMVTFGSLLEELLVFCKLLGIGEGDTVYPLEGVVIRVAEPIGCGMLHKVSTKGFNLGNWRTLVTMNALMRPVCGTCGPKQRSIIGPQRYTVVEVLSGTFVSIK